MNSKELIEKLSEKVHNAWWREKERQGKADGHPDAIPYNELSEDTKEYDRATVRTVLKAIEDEGMAIVPEEKLKELKEYCTVFDDGSDGADGESCSRAVSMIDAMLQAHQGDD